MVRHKRPYKIKVRVMSQCYVTTCLYFLISAIIAEFSREFSVEFNRTKS